MAILNLFAVATLIVVALIRLLLTGPPPPAPPATDLALLGAVWITFYPVARLKRTEPWWAHWARGVVILIAFLLAQQYL